MAKVISGSFETTSKNSRKLQFSWTCTQDIDKNQSTINWKVVCTGTATNYNMSAPFLITVAGKEYKYTTRIQLYVGTEVASGSTTITHNDDGTRSFTASVKGAIFDADYNVRGSETWDLKDIPRAATIKSAVNFNDEGTPSITYDNPAGDSATVYVGLYWDKDATNALVSNTKVGGSGTVGGTYNFSLTTAQKNAIYSKLANAKSTTIYYGLKSVIGGTTYTKTLAKTVSITNATPTITATAEDTGGNSTTLTGNTAKMIKGFNVISCTCAGAAKKGATIKSYKITNGSNILNTNTGTFVNSENNKFTFTATDSRGNTVSKDITLTMIDYIKLTGDAAAKMEVASGGSATTANLTVDIAGNYFNGSFGAKSNSLRVSIYQEQMETGAHYTDEYSVPTSQMSGGKYTFQAYETGYPYENTWKIVITVSDAINSITLPEKIVSAKPVFDWSGEDFNFNVPIHYQGKAIDFVVEQGTKDGWYYRNWKSGYGEAWKTITVNTAINTAWGTMYGGSTKMSRQTYPFPFADKPVEQATLQTASNPAWLIPESTGNGVNGAYASAIYNVVKHTTATATDYYISLYVCGKLLNS